MTPLWVPTLPPPTPPPSPPPCLSISGVWAGPLCQQGRQAVFTRDLSVACDDSCHHLRCCHPSPPPLPLSSVLSFPLLNALLRSQPSTRVTSPANHSSVTAVPFSGWRISATPLLSLAVWLLPRLVVGVGELPFQTTRHRPAEVS